jgi:ATP-dependent DNA helicase RecQ
MAMKVLIVAKTRRGSGACVGGITWEGRSVRLIAADAETNDRAGLEYNVGEVWELELTPDPSIVPPHVENVVVRQGRRLKRLEDAAEFIRRHMPPAVGGPELLFDGMAQHSPAGGLYIARTAGLPSRSTMFWVPDRALQINCEGKRIRYRYPTPDGGRTLTFVGFQEPVEVIPAGTLLRVSLAHWWRPKEKPDEELRCYAQLSGWHIEPGAVDDPCIELPRVCGGIHASFLPEERPELDRAREMLKRRFGFSEFLPLQEEVISRVLRRRDTLAVMPTGGGKSLCYQLPALLFEGLTAVVSPLIALMQDQVSQLRELGIPAAFLNSTLLLREHVAVASRARSGTLKILYAAPETMLRPETLLLLEQSGISCLAVDEAHCISEWGHDFRPEYRQLDEVRRRFPQAVCLALTATATPRVRADIRRLLRLEPDAEFVASFDRPNLLLTVQPRLDGLGQTLAFLNQHRDKSGIIYCAKRKQVDRLAAELQARGWPASPYHAGLDDRVRHQNQEQFLGEDTGIMVATVAFGMGINKSNVRFVLHYNLPKDIESYYQEIGRAGRDGLPADCLLLHSRADAITVRHFIDEGAPSERPGRQARLDALIRYAETIGCRRLPLLSYFGETPAKECGHCDNCRATRNPSPLTDVTEAARKFLSCVKRTGESFGVSHIVDVLRGSRSQKVLSRGHDRLSTYGIGLEFTAEQWRELARQFIGQGLLDQDMQYGGLSLTPKAWRVFKDEKVFVSVASPQAESSEAAPAEHDEELFQHLRALRLQLARQAGMPTYIIFSDRALIEMARHFPQDDQQFLAISGVGEAKLAKHGAEFLRLIRDHCQNRSLRPSPPPVEKPQGSTDWLTVKRRFKEVGELFEAGHSLDELAGRFSVKRATIVQNLARHFQNGGRLNPDRLLAASSLSPPEQERVLAVFGQLGTERLAPVYDALGGSISYDELRLLQLFLLSVNHRAPRRESSSP